MKKLFTMFFIFILAFVFAGCGEKEDITNYITFPKQWNYGDNSSIAGYSIILNYKNNHLYKLEIFNGCF